MRYIFIPKKLSKALLKYAKDKKITSGSVFVAKNGVPLDRSNIWAEMKKLCTVEGKITDGTAVFNAHSNAKIFIWDDNMRPITEVYRK